MSLMINYISNKLNLEKMVAKNNIRYMKFTCKFRF